jgi:hypothetical protein
VESKMNNIRSPMRFALVAAAFLALPVQTALAQQAPAATIVRTVMAVASLPNVVDAPVFFKLSKIELSPGQTTKYSGPVGFIYLLSGALVVQSDVGQRSLQQDDALLGPVYNYSHAPDSQGPKFLIQG